MHIVSKGKYSFLQHHLLVYTFPSAAPNLLKSIYCVPVKFFFKVRPTVCIFIKSNYIQVIET